MPLLAESLSVWDISFRVAGHDPRRLWLRVPLEVEDNFRNFMNAILSGELGCENISLEKRKFEPDQKEFSVYFWIDEIYDCIFGRRFSRKLLHWAHVDRFDFMLWCERMNAPLPEFWFPHGWNIKYELPEGHLTPGHEYIRRDWTTEDWVEWKKELKVIELRKTTPASPSQVTEQSENAQNPIAGLSINSLEAAADKLRPNQEARLACQQIAKVIWQSEPDRTIASIVKDELIQKYGGGSFYVEDTVREWVKAVAPPHVSKRRGAPRKNRDKDK